MKNEPDILFQNKTEYNKMTLAKSKVLSFFYWFNMTTRQTHGFTTGQGRHSVADRTVKVVHNEGRDMGGQNRISFLFFFSRLIYFLFCYIRRGL
jgi:hypothetical protein